MVRDEARRRPVGVSGTSGTLVRRHAVRVRADVRRLRRTGVVPWDEALVAGLARPVPPRTPRPVEEDPYKLVAGATSASLVWRSLSSLARACFATEVLHRLVVSAAATDAAHGAWSGLAPEQAAQFEGVEARRRASQTIALALRTQNVRTKRRLLPPRPTVPTAGGFSYVTELVPRGVSAVFVGEESPCWAAYPAVFADLVAGNTVIVAPTALATGAASVLVETWQAVLAEHGFPEEVVQLALTPEDEPSFERALVSHHLLVLIDDVVPGSTWSTALATNAPQAWVSREPRGRHVVLLDTEQHHDHVLAGLAAAGGAGAALAAHPLLVVVPRDGITTGGRRLGADEVVQDVRRVAEAAATRPARRWEVVIGPERDRVFHHLDGLDKTPGVRALHVVSSDPATTGRATAWAHDVGAFLLMESSSSGAISDVRAREAEALLDEDFVVSRLRTHHVAVRS